MYICTQACTECIPSCDRRRTNMLLTSSRETKCFLKRHVNIASRQGCSQNESGSLYVQGQRRNESICLAQEEGANVLRARAVISHWIGSHPRGASSRKVLSTCLVHDTFVEGCFAASIIIPVNRIRYTAKYLSELISCAA